LIASFVFKMPSKKIAKRKAKRASTDDGERRLEVKHSDRDASES